MKERAIEQLADQYWEFVLKTNPTTALLLGDHRYDDRMEDISLAAENETIATLDHFTADANAIQPESLSRSDQITRAMLAAEAAGWADELRSRMAELDVNPTLGTHVSLPQLAGQFSISGSEQAGAIVTKWAAIEGLFTQMINRLRQGLVEGRTPPATSVKKVVRQIDDYLASPTATDPFVTLPAPSSFTAAEEATWRDQLRHQVEGPIRRGYASYREALANEVFPKARPQEKVGLRWLPDGEEVYDRAVRRHTTLDDMTAYEIHQVGLEVVQELEGEYRQIGSSVLGTSDLGEIYERLRNDQELRFETPSQIVAAARGAMGRASEATGSWFGVLPQARCVVNEIPAVGAEDSTLAFYLPPALDASRPGSYFVNTSLPTTRTRYESEALAFHESIPGHHLQVSIAQELEGIPEFRKHALVTAYVEGWGLYTERLADEMGLYSDDLARMGMLSFDSWRACRLVVDTGMHSLGWSRQESIEFMAANSPQADNNIVAEVDRYIAWPGQALAYMTGRRHISSLRSAAETTLGPAFDISAFHDVVLGSGPVPLTLLSQLVADWVSSE